MKHRWWYAGVVLGGVVLGATACGDDRARAGAPASGERRCAEDVDCPEGFCDSSGVCGGVDVTTRFGTACKPAPVTPAGLVMGREHSCGAYFCVDGRCRSCRSDRECREASNLPSSTCRQNPGWPGNRCGNYSAVNTLPPRTEPGVSLPYQELRVEVRRVYPHAIDAFTEGLVYDSGGWIFESTGLLGQSSLRRVELETGRVDATVSLPAGVFGEGLAVVGDRLIQLSYQGGRAFVWSKSALARLGELTYDGPGWGLCHDGTHLVMSDGTDVLQVRDPVTFEVVRRVPVRKRGLPLPLLNELECLGGDVYANVHQQRHIARIDLASGTVTGWIDTGLLLDQAGAGADRSRAADLNGIAHVPERGTWLLTGKRWPAIFEVTLHPLLQEP